MGAPRSIEGPYCVKRAYLGFIVVYMVDETTDTWKHLIPPSQPYTDRVNAHRRAAKLNREWQLGLEDARRKEYYPMG